MATPKKESREEKLFRKYSFKIKEAILHPKEIANELYSDDIIGSHTRDKIHQTDQSNGANELIIAVEAYIRSQKLGKRLEKRFAKILDIFNKHTPLNSIVSQMKDEYNGGIVDDTDSQNDQSFTKKETKKSYTKTVENKKTKNVLEPIQDKRKQEEKTKKTEAKSDLTAEEHKMNKISTDHSNVEMSLPTEITNTTTDVSSPQDACYNIFSDPHVKHLAEALKVYSSDLNESELESEAIALIKARIEAHIKKRSGEHFPKESIKKHLTDLTMNALIPSDIVGWCYETLDKVYADLDSSVSSGSGEDPEDDCSANRELPPIFSKDTVYHASLCLLALSRHPSQSLSTLSDCGHSFDSISFSITNHCKMMIAQQGDIIYISFADDTNPHIHEQIPMRYFCELLHQDKRLIFTGYSFGSYAAQNVLECLWELPFFNRDVLLQNTACIMFGTCYHNVDVLYSESNDVDSSSHLFVLEGELLNLFYRNNEISISQDIIHLDDDGILNKLNTIIIKEQEGDINYERLQDLSYSKRRDDFFKLIQEFSEIKMKDYHLKVLRGYLEKAPDPYPIPPRQDFSSIKGVQSLFPSISSVELHQHEHPKGYELAVVINGDNLWFCHEIKVISDDIKDIEFKITPECVTQKQISYNFPLKSMITFQEVNVQVAVFSTFRNLSPERYSTTYSVPDPISFRQSQLAKQTPSQIIQLSFLSALLEQSPSVQAGRPTKRFTSIIKFLQESARIVPLESITSAIAGCDDHDTACKYAQAFLSAAYSSPIPVSKLMASGCESARNALGLGVYIHSWGHHRSYVDIVESSRSRSYMEGYHARSYMEGLHYSEPVLEGSHYSTSPFVEGPLHYNRPLMGYSDPVMDPPASIRYSISSADYGNKPSKKNKTGPGLPLPLPSAVVLDLTENKKKILLDEFHPDLISQHFKIFSARLLSLPANSRNLICGRNIGEAYPISEASFSCNALIPLPMVLQKARHDLAAYSTFAVDTSIGSKPQCNSDMLETVNKIINNDLKPCVTMLGGFMEQQIRVPLVNNPLDTAKAIITAEKSGAVGVWALFAMSYEDIARIPRSRKNQALVIQITKFIKGLSSTSEKINKQDIKTTTYNAKLQFLLQGMRPTISCSYEYISYSLERELVGICKQRNISTSTRIDTIVHSWDVTFKSTALTLVSHQYRPLLARWLIWALNIHQLRETLASYTTVGVIGLVNSGKSTLVNKVFNIKTVQGDTQSARTTVPLIYNLDNEVEGLSVIDFPGVDDRDDSIGKLAELLVGLAQIVIFVCEYKRFHTKSAEEWMDIFHKKFVSSPILVCLTNADRLYEEKCDDDMIPSCPEEKVTSLKIHFEKELETTIGSTKAKMSRNCDVKFCSLTQSRHSPLNNEEGRQSMRKVGIFTPQDVGEWIKHALEVKIQQKDLADKLGRFLAEQK